MKLLISISATMLLTACGSLMNASGAAQPVLVKDAKQQIMFTSCSGAVEDWGSCNRKAKNTCKNGYEILEQIESPIGGKREITFQCK